MRQRRGEEEEGDSISACLLPSEKLKRDTREQVKKWVLASVAATTKSGPYAFIFFAKKSHNSVFYR